MPSRSISAHGTTTTDQASARRTTGLVHPLARGGGEQLGVGQLVDLTAGAGRERDRADDQRPGARPAARLVGAGDDVEAVPVQGPLVAPQPGLAAHHRALRPHLSPPPRR